MSVLTIDVGKTYWYHDGGDFHRVTGVNVLVGNNEVLFLVDTSRRDRNTHNLGAQRVCVVPGESQHYLGHDLFADKTSAAAARAAKLRKQADAVESM